MRIALLCILALACTGCPQKLVSRSVTLAGFTGQPQAPGNVSVADPAVQTALKIIDQVVVSDGYAPATNTNFTVPGALITYVKSNPEGTLSGLGPSVSLKDKKLVITIAGRGTLSHESEQLLKTIRTELRREYGADRVTTGR